MIKRFTAYQTSRLNQYTSSEYVDSDCDSAASGNDSNSNISISMSMKTSTSTSTSMATTNETDETIKKNYRVIDQSNNESESENFLDSCGCPSSCNFWNLMDKNQSMGFLCEERIQFLTKRYKLPRHKACIASANAGYCTLSCHPEVCTPFTPEPFNNTSAIASTKTMTKMIHYILDARTEGQYHTLYDGNQCPDKDRPGFPSTLSQPGQLDFATHITTNLKILVMGDSVGAHQIGQNFMEAATFNMTQTNIDMNNAMTHIHAPGKMPYPNNHVSAIPTRGGGTAMVYRANSGMLSRKLLRDAPMGVSAHHVRGLQQHLHITTGSSSVDAMVLAIPSGWIGFEQQINDAITQETLAESVRWAGEIFGAKVVVLPTVMLSGNLFKDLEGNFFPIRKKIYEFAKYFHSNVNSSSWHGVEQVVVLDLASLSLELVRANAQALGLMKEDDGNKDSNHALQEALLGHTIIKTSKKGDFQVPVALICSEVVSANATTCTKNRFSVDGMHWCMKNGVGGRIQAGLACVLSCAYPNQKQVAGHFSVTDCETDCNNRFMNIHAPTFGEGDLATSSSA